MSPINPRFNETELNQPWKAWVEQGFPKLEEAEADSDSEVQELCPGGTECGNIPHKLGSTKFCAVEIKRHGCCKWCGIVPCACITGTSG